ncbi:MAG: hypothetical protein KAW00_01080 [Dehalococcoidia bacterium]|nr:hypothetical protein [Dehalococcoidia bacterium]
MERVVYEVMVRCELVQPKDRASSWTVDELKSHLDKKLKLWSEKVRGELENLDISISPKSQ